MAIKALGDNRYKIFVDKKDYNSGKRKTKTKTVTTKLQGKQLQAFLFTEEAKLEQEAERLLEELTNPGELTLEEYFNKVFLKGKKREQHTIDWYVQYLENRTYDYFKDKKIKNITENDVKAFFGMLDREVTNKGKPLSPKTKKHYKTVLNAIFNDAIENNGITSNPTDKIKISVPNRPLNTDKFYSPDEIEVCINALDKHSDVAYLTYFVLSYMCCFRPAEIMGLKWNKVDFENQELLIDKSLASTTVGYIYKDTKNGNIRTSVLTDYALTLLSIHKQNELQKYNKLKLKIPFEENYVFTTETGRHWYATKFRKYWTSFCKKYGLRYIPPYGLRHTGATILAYNNVPLPNIAKYLGDYNIETAQKYVHAVDGLDNEIKDIFTSTTNQRFKVL